MGSVSRRDAQRIVEPKRWHATAHAAARAPPDAEAQLGPQHQAPQRLGDAPAVALRLDVPVLPSRHEVIDDDRPDGHHRERA
eukprot:6190355-Pleurochrysis_carterae.AAC.1